LIFVVLGGPRTAKVKHQSQRGEVLSDVGQNESKIKRNNFPAGLDKVGGFIEAQGFNPGTLKLNEFALKGREADRMKLAPIAAQNLECASETCYN
jgi:hypothetical protein